MANRSDQDRHTHRPTAWQIVGGIAFLLLLPLFRPVVAPIDPVGYYAWARSLLIDGDLDVANEFEHYDMPEGAPRTSTGYLHNQWPAGSGLLWLPAMGLAHAAATGLSQLGLPVAPDGYSWPYAWSAALTSVAAGLGAVLLTYRLSRRFAGRYAALSSVLLIWLATPLVFYQYHQPYMSHALDACLNALFIRVWLWTEEGDRPRLSMVVLGIIIGAAVWVRPQNGVLLIAVGIILVYDAAVRQLASDDRPGVDRVAVKAIGLFVGFVALTAPLLFFWRRVYGQWIVNTYHIASGDSFDWRAPYVLHVLFSTDRGLFVWMPVSVFCIAGIWWLRKRVPRLTVLLSLVALMHLYVIGSWSSWSGGDAFGPRFWIAQLPFFGLALAALIDHLDHGPGRGRVGLSVLAAALIAWNLLLMLQYSVGLLPPSGTVRLDTMVEQQAIVLPQLGSRLIERVRRLVEQLR